MKKAIVSFMILLSLSGNVVASEVGERADDVDCVSTLSSSRYERPSIDIEDEEMVEASSK